MSSVSPRLIRRIERDFPKTESNLVVRLVGGVGETRQDSERIQAAAVICARGDLSRLTDILLLIERDWRDALVGAELDHADWAQKLDAELGPRD
jgi:hypothetical protein